MYGYRGLIDSAHPDDGDVGDACQGEEDHVGAGGCEDQKKYQNWPAVGHHCQTSEQLLPENERVWIQPKLQILSAEVGC